MGRAYPREVFFRRFDIMVIALEAGLLQIGKLIPRKRAERAQGDRPISRTRRIPLSDRFEVLM